MYSSWIAEIALRSNAVQSCTPGKGNPDRENEMSDSSHLAAKLAPVIVAVCLIAASGTACAERWEVTTLREEVPGTREIEAGQYEKAILDSNRFYYRASSRFAPEYQMAAVLTNLCIAHIALHDYEQSSVYCKRAASEPANRSVTLNNLGVLFGLRGDIESAARFFAMAANADCLGRCSHAESVPRTFPRPTARRNLERAEILLRTSGSRYVARTTGSVLEEFE